MMEVKKIINLENHHQIYIEGHIKWIVEPHGIVYRSDGECEY